MATEQIPVISLRRLQIVVDKLETKTGESPFEIDADGNITPVDENKDTSNRNP